MKNKILVIMFAASMGLSLSACGGGNSEGSSAEKQEQAVTEGKEEKVEKEEEEEKAETKVEQINMDNSEGSLVYVRHELTKDYNGADAIRVYFTYTNKSDDAKMVQTAFSPQIFQNKVECEFTVGNFEERNEAYDNLTKQVMKDGSLEVAFIYTLQDVTNPVILKVTDYSAENLLKDIYQEQELTLQ